jgi:predicted Zn-dependent peptidase
MKHFRIFILALVLVLVGGQAAAQIDRTKKPDPGPAPKASFPEFYETKLDNGLKVLIVTNTAQPVVNFRLLIKSGSEYEGDKSGVAGFVTDLLTAGTTSRTSLAFAQEADFLGLNIGAGAADDQMSVTGSGLKKHMDKLLTLMTDALYNPSFPEDELDKLKKQTLSGLKTVHKSPDAVMGRLQITVGYNVHPYANFQTEEEVGAITKADLAAFHKTYFIPNNSSLAIVGDVTPEEILPIVKKYFGSWAKGTVPTNDFPAPKAIAGREVHLVDLGKTQTQTAISVSTSSIKRNNSDYIALSMMNSIIGGGFSGRLFANLREKHGFTYGAYSSVEARKDAGMWNATASVRRIATDSAFAQIILEMKRMREETVDAAELAMHKEYASGRFLLGLENPSSIATMVQNIDLYDLPADYYRNYVRNLMAITPADIQRVARTYLDVDNMAILAVGDADVIAEPLMQLGQVKMYDTDMNPVEAPTSFEVDIDAATLLEKHIEALGGRATLEKLTSRITEADVTLDLGMAQGEGMVVETAMLPNKKHQLLTLAISAQGQTQMIESEVWIDGENVVQRQPMQPPRALTGEDRDQQLEEEQFNDIVRYNELGYTTSVTEKKSMDDRVVYVLEVKKHFGTEELYVDAKTFLLHGKAETQNTPQGPVTTVTTYGDYRSVDGMMLPYSNKVVNPMMTLQATVTKYTHNSDIDEAIFSKEAK